MPSINIDLEDGEKPISFILNGADMARFTEFLDECNGYKKALEQIREADEKLAVYAPDECSRAYRIASEALGLTVYPKAT